MRDDETRALLELFPIALQCLRETGRVLLDGEKLLRKIDAFLAGMILIWVLAAPSGYAAEVTLRNATKTGVNTKAATLTIAEVDNNFIAVLEGQITRDATQTLTAGTSINCEDDTLVPIAGSGGPVDLTSNPQIADPTKSNKICVLEGTSDTNTVTLDNGTGLVLPASVTLGAGDLMVFFYNGTDWIGLAGLAVSLAPDAVDAIGEIASALRTGADTQLVTGTAGSPGNCAEWDASGDLVQAASGQPCGSGATSILVGTPSELTIAAGAITASGEGYFRVDTQSDAGTDDLDTINGLTDGDTIILTSENASREVTLRHATGNLRLAGGINFTMNALCDNIMLRLRGSVLYEHRRMSCSDS